MNTAATSSPAYGSGLWLFLLASLLVIALTYAAVRLVGKWQVTATRGRRLRVLEGVPLGRDRSLLLVAVGKELLVVGSSPQGVQLVYQITDPETRSALLAESEGQDGSSGEADPEPAIQEHLQAMRELLSHRRQGHDR